VRIGEELRTSDHSTSIFAAPMGLDAKSNPSQ
jgi:hypothetical protein